ncbi:hypothetical protein WN55_11357 [Dufourea novaeangliae]|uniref:Uncharacterized protein n=1 Tax=Dufourea novaeangliae TaxID=178035 RepID=A0A154PBR7_DUFNO|nr:hypothetical protein WN55_11357 [Dufourea novaeangliae]
MVQFASVFHVHSKLFLRPSKSHAKIVSRSFTRPVVQELTNFLKIPFALIDVCMLGTARKRTLDIVVTLECSPCISFIGDQMSALTRQRISAQTITPAILAQDFSLKRLSLGS